MKYLIAVTIFLSAVMASDIDDSLTVILSNRTLYTDSSGIEVIADHYLLSDSSLHFIKLTLFDLHYTMPQTVSASGVRYSDGMNMTWWERSDSAMVQQRDSLGNWETTTVFRIR